jgi:hypothetical protein
MPLDNLTLAILRKAEFGFFGVMVVTFKQTPRKNGRPVSMVFRRRRKTLNVVCKAGAFDLALTLRRFLLIN